MKSSLGLGPRGLLMYESYLTMYSTQSTISSYFGAQRFGVHLWIIPMYMRSIRRLGIRRIQKYRSQDGGK
jgi:hypothetical protein